MLLRRLKVNCNKTPIKFDDFISKLRSFEIEFDSFDECRIIDVDEIYENDNRVIGLDGTIVINAIATQDHDGMTSGKYIPIAFPFEYISNDFETIKKTLESYGTVNVKGKIELRKWEHEDELIEVPVMKISKIDGHYLSFIPTRDPEKLLQWLQEQKFWSDIKKREKIIKR